MPIDSSTDKAIAERYRSKYQFQDAAFRILDLVAYRSSSRSYGRGSIDKTSVRKILLANAGHMGDIIISTALLPILQASIPGVSLAFLTGAPSKPILDSHPAISKTFYLDHWFVSRSEQGIFTKYRDFRHLRRQVVEQIRAEQYDLAIDLRAWFPNFISILHEAEIPIRIGFDRVGGGPLLTHAYRYQYDRRHELQHQLDLLGPLNLPPESIQNAWPYLPDSEDASSRIVTSLCAQGEFCVLHPCSSSPARDWPQQNWIILAKHLVDNGIVPCITGSGPRDAAIAAEIARAVPSAVNFCGTLSWEELVHVVRRAKAVYSVETSVGHLASALGKPVISIYGGMSDPRHWAPLGATVVSNQIPCSPCFDKKGCSHRSCLTGVSSNDVVSIDIIGKTPAG